MKNTPLLVLAAMAVLFFQNCKKGSSDDATTTTYKLSATVNGTSWTPDTLSATITYNAATKTKTFAFSGNYLQRQISCAVKLTDATATNTNDFPVAGYNVDDNSDPLMVYSYWQKNSDDVYAFVPVATAAYNEGIVTVSAINTQSKLISGSFNFSHKQTNYDSNGNAVSITNTTVTSGAFTNLPYTFVSN